MQNFKTQITPSGKKAEMKNAINSGHFDLLWKLVHKNVGEWKTYWTKLDVFNQYKQTKHPGKYSCDYK